jgi:DnaK suppressor protein
MSKSTKKGKVKRDSGRIKSVRGTAVLKALKSKDKVKSNSTGKKTALLKIKSKDSKDKVKSKDRDKPILKASNKKAPPAPVRPQVKLSKEMLEIRARLQTMLSDMRRDIDHEVRGASERDLAHINDTSDMASDAAEGDLALRIAESETVEASEIERAIEKIDSGTYGVCEMCNQQIGADRLRFLPYVTLCIKCQELAEIRRREESEELDDLAEGSEADSENN